MSKKITFPAGENYRFSSVGTIKVYGNSVEIEEQCNPTPKKALRNIVIRETEYAQKLLPMFEYAFEGHVIKYGPDFPNHPFWFHGKNYNPKYKDVDTDEETETEESATPKRERGDITGLSQKARYRMMKKMNRINPDEMDTMYSLTLTYPKEFPKDGVTHKTDLDVFIKRLKRKFGEDVEYLWKLEFQKRGAPHYHIVVNLPKTYKVPYLQNWLGKNWYEVAQRFWDEKLENHLKAGTELQKIKNVRTASHYLCKYLTKELDIEVKNQGRYWGSSRNWGTLIHEAELTGRQLVQFRRLVKRYTKKNHARMAKMITLPLKLTVFGYWKVFVQALEWIEQVH